MAGVNEFLMLSMQHLAANELQQAQKGFTRIVDSDPMVCDAWLGRIAAGDASLPVLAGAYQSRGNIGLAVKNARSSLDVLKPVFTLDLDAIEFQLGIRTETHIAVAYAAALASQETPDVAGAAVVVEKQRSRPGLSVWDLDLLDYVWLCLLGLACRWPDVLMVTKSHEWRVGQASGEALERNRRQAFVDLLNLGKLVWHVRALAGTGNPGEAQRWVEQRLDQNDPLVPTDVHVRLRLARVYMLRMQGRAEEAERALGEVSAISAAGGVADAVADPDKTIPVVTAQSLATRTDMWDVDSGVSARELEDREVGKRREAALDAAWGELDEQVGQEGLKREVRRLAAAMKMARRRADHGMDDPDIALAFSFTGPPGTGKTTMARVLAQLLFGLGIVARPHVREVRGKDLTGAYLGKTKEVTNQVIDDALGGLLFIDEAYSLATKGFSGGDAYGKEAVDTLLARMENERRTDDPRKKLVVVIAGYEDDIRDLMAVNDGLASRFTRRIVFPSYSPNELVEIAEVMGDKLFAGFTPGCREPLLSGVTSLSRQVVERVDEVGNTKVRPAIDIAGNARFMRNIVEIAKDNRDFRLADIEQLDATAMRTVSPADVISAFKEACINQDVPCPALADTESETPDITEPDPALSDTLSR